MSTYLDLCPYAEGILGNDLIDTVEFESHLHSKVQGMNNKQLKALVSDHW